MSLSKYSGRYDAELYWQRKIYPPTHRIVTSVFPEIDWDGKYMNKRKKKDKAQKDLDFFFKKQ